MGRGETGRSKLAGLLHDGIEAMGLVVSAHTQGVLLDYVGLLHKWNKAFNLSAIREPEQMISRHLLDSLSLVPLLQEFMEQQVTKDSAEARPVQVLDVGTGAGLPGIPLALNFPDVRFVLLDSNGKKTRFVLQAVLELGINNVNVENTRIESYQSPEQLDIVVSRAFSSLADFAENCTHLSGPETRLLAMKGQLPVNELSALPAGWRVSRTVTVDIPGSEAERHIIELRKTQDRQTAAQMCRSVAD